MQPSGTYLYCTALYCNINNEWGLYMMSRIYFTGAAYEN